MVMLINISGFGVVVPLLPFYGTVVPCAALGDRDWVSFSAYSARVLFRRAVLGAAVRTGSGGWPILIRLDQRQLYLCYLALAFAPGDVRGVRRAVSGRAGGRQRRSVVQGYIADVTPANERAGRMSLLGAAYVGMIIGPTLGGIFAHPGAGRRAFGFTLLIAACRRRR